MKVLAVVGTQSGVPQVTGFAQAIQRFQEFETLIRLQVELGNRGLDEYVATQRLGRLQISLTDIGRSYLEFVHRSESEQESDRLRL